MTLYNCKIDGDHYRLTKFTPDLEVESSYLTSEAECECPAGHRHTCRHRQMLPLFIEKSATRGQWFLDFDRKVWIKAVGEEEPEAQESTVPTPEAVVEPEPDYSIAAKGDALRESAAAAGFHIFDLSNPAALHNAIAEAVGEPEAIVRPSPKLLRRI